MFEVLTRGRGGTKGGAGDADGVGVATGNGGGDMELEGVLVRDFAVEVGCAGEGEEACEEDERGIGDEEGRASDESDEYLKMATRRAAFYAALL